MKLSVRFASDIDNEIHEVSKLSDRSQEEIENTWFTKREYRRSMNETKKALQAMNDSAPYNGCIRGLETKTIEGARNKRAVTLGAVDAVLEEQACQQERQMYDPERIAAAYIKVVTDSVRNAHEMGILDFMDVATPEQLEKNTLINKMERRRSSSFLFPKRNSTRFLVSKIFHRRGSTGSSSGNKAFFRIRGQTQDKLEVVESNPNEDKQ